MRRIGAVIGIVALAFVFSACARKFTGSGELGTADFEFVYKVENSNGTGKAKGSFHDKSAVINQTPVPMRFRFDGILSSSSGGPDNCIRGTLGYISQDRDFPGTGQVQVEGCDNGEPSGPSNGDTLTVQVTSGPYAGYFNSGTVEGNLQAHD